MTNDCEHLPMKTSREGFPVLGTEMPTVPCPYVTEPFAPFIASGVDNDVYSYNFAIYSFGESRNGEPLFMQGFRKLEDAEHALNNLLEKCPADEVFFPFFSYGEWNRPCTDVLEWELYREYGSDPPRDPLFAVGATCEGIVASFNIGGEHVWDVFSDSRAFALAKKLREFASAIESKIKCDESCSEWEEFWW